LENGGLSEFPEALEAREVLGVRSTSDTIKKLGSLWL
jgi:hypothetical protein